MHQPVNPDTRERGTPLDRARIAAGRLWIEMADRPGFVRVDVDGDPPRLIVVLSLPVLDPGNLFARIDGFSVFRRGASC